MEKPVEPNNAALAATAAEKKTANKNSRVVNDNSKADPYLRSVNVKKIFESIVAKSKSKEKRTPEEIALLNRIIKTPIISRPKYITNTTLILPHTPSGYTITSGGKRTKKRSKKAKKTRKH